ncbi:MAG: hypothetical protein ABW208_25565 [Pyrinomonadaceae bacterium]
MKSSLSWVARSACLVLCCFGFARAQDAKPAAAAVPPPEQQARGGVFTLHWYDPLTRALCLRDGKAGQMIRDNRVGNRCSDLSLTTAGGGNLVTAIEANRVGVIIDLGTADELRERYGYEDAEAGGEGFASLRVHEGKLVILKEDGPPEKLQPLREASALFAPGRPSAPAPIKLGHIYLLRIEDAKDRGFQLLAKLIVIAYRPGESVSLRWELL